MRRLALIALVSLSVAGCADKQAPPPEVAAPPKAAVLTAPSDSATAGDRIQRPMLDAVLHQGPAWLLERVPIEDVQDQGKFVGWRVLELPGGWEAIALKPGDVVTHINALPIETPNDFWAAWTTLSVASELRVAYLRDGESHEFSMPIEGSPDPALSQRLLQQGETPPPREPGTVPGRPRQKRTIIIKGKERPESDTTVDWSDDG